MNPITVTRFLGTCQICEQEQKLHMRGLVHHGFKRPGHGSIEGDCYGVHAVPYEVSCDLVKKYLVIVANEIVSSEARLVQLQTPGAVTTLFRTNGYQSKTFTLGESDPITWRQEMERAIGDIKYKITCLKREVTRLEARITNWKLAPIRTVEEGQAEEKAAKDARAAVRNAARQIKADKVAATKARQSALQAERDAIMLDFKTKFLALAESPKPLDRFAEAYNLATKMSQKKYSFFYARELRIDDAFVLLGLATPDPRNVNWVNYKHPLG